MINGMHDRTKANDLLPKRVYQTLSKRETEV